MKDELDSLPDAQLSEVFAVEVAGYYEASDGYTYMVEYNHEDRWLRRYECPPYATSANAVLPFLDICKFEDINGTRVSIRKSDEYWVVGLSPATWDDSEYIGYAPTFARAACIALISAARAQKGQP